MTKEKKEREFPWEKCMHFDRTDLIFLVTSLLIFLIVALFFTMIYAELNIPLLMYAAIHFVLWLDFKFPQIHKAS